MLRCTMPHRVATCRALLQHAAPWPATSCTAVCQVVPAACHLLPSLDAQCAEQLHAAYCLLHVACCVLRVARCTLPVACCALRVAHAACNTQRCVLRVACCALRVAHAACNMQRCVLRAARCVLHWAVSRSSTSGHARAAGRPAAARSACGSVGR